MNLDEYVKSFFRCLECELLFESSEQISQHYAECHKNKKKQTNLYVHVDFLPDWFYDEPDAQVCRRCAKIFETRRLLQQHFNDVHKINILHCPNCDVFLKSTSSLRKHFKIVHSCKVIFKNNKYYGYVHLQKPDEVRQASVEPIVSDRQSCIIPTKDQSANEPTVVQDHSQYDIEQVPYIDEQTVVQDHTRYYIARVPDDARNNDTETAANPLIANPMENFSLELSDKPIIRSLVIIPSTAPPIISKNMLSDAVAKWERKDMGTQTSPIKLIENCEPVIKKSTRETQTCSELHIAIETIAKPANDLSKKTDQSVLKRNRSDHTPYAPNSIIVNDTNNYKSLSENNENENIAVVDLNNNSSNKDVPFVRKLSVEEDIGNGYCPNCPLGGMGFFNEEVRKTHRCLVLHLKPNNAPPNRNVNAVKRRITFTNSKYKQNPSTTELCTNR